MKNIMKHAALIIAILAFVVGSVFGQEAPKGYLRLKGNTMDEQNLKTDVKIHITDLSTGAEEFVSTRKGAFNFTLKLDRNYSLEYYAPGKLTKYIDVKAACGNYDNYYRFEFDLVMYPIIHDEFPKPVAIVYFNPSTKVFDYIIR